MAFTLDQKAYDGLLSNPNITEGVIGTLLLSRPNKWILEAIAGSDKASQAQLELVYEKSKSYDVLYNLAGNPKYKPVLSNDFRTTEDMPRVIFDKSVTFSLIEEEEPI